jgi:2'-5' RNA ligase
MPDTTRTFLAVPIPEAVASAIARIRAKLEPDAPGVKWVEARHYHITLAFLGDVDVADLAGVCRAATEAAAGFGPFELKAEGLGAFPNPGRPRNLWVGIAGSGVETLGGLQKALARAVAGAGYRPEEERFSPHVTIGRFKSRPGRGTPSPPPDVSAAVARHKTWSGGVFRVAEAVVFGSNLTPEGPEYTPLARGKLAGRKTESSP